MKVSKKTKTITLLVVIPLILIVVVLALYSTHREVPFQILNLEVSEMSFSTKERLQFGKISELKKLDIYNHIVKIENSKKMRIKDLPEKILKKYNEVEIILEGPHQYLTIVNQQELLNSVIFNIDITPDPPGMITTIKDMQDMVFPGKIDFISNTDTLKNNNSGTISSAGTIRFVPGENKKRYEIEFIITGGTVVLKNSVSDTLLEADKNNTLTMIVPFSNSTWLSLRSPANSSQARFTFFSDNITNPVPLLIVKEQPLTVSDLQFTPSSTQTGKFDLEYEDKEPGQEETSFRLKENNETRIIADKIEIEKSILTLKSNLLLSARGKSKEILNSNGSNIVSNNLLRVPSIVTIIIAIIVYVVDKIIMLANFFKEE